MTTCALPRISKPVMSPRRLTDRLDTADELLGHDDLDRHHRLEQHGAGLFERSLIAIDAAILNDRSDESTSCACPSTRRTATSTTG